MVENADLHRKRLVAAEIIAGMIVIGTLFVFLWGTQATAVVLSNLFVPAFAVLNAGVAILVWRYLRQNQPAKRVFFGFAAGFSLWAVAEIIWALYLLAGVEPYPSFADIFWIVGYFPLAFGLASIPKIFQVRLTSRQRYWIYAVILLVVGLTAGYLLVPILQYFELSDWLTSCLNLVYPVLSLVVFSQAVYIFFVTRKSRFSLPWGILAFGLGFMVFVDLAFSYADWNELYVYDQANLLTRLIDWGYLAGNPIYILGAYVYYLSMQQTEAQQVAERTLDFEQVTNTLYLFFLDRKNLVIDSSDNVIEIVPVADTAAIGGQPIDQVLRLDLGQRRTLLEQLGSNTIVKDLPILVGFADNQFFNAWLCAVPSQDIAQNYAGANLLVRVRIAGRFPNPPLSRFQKGVVEYIFERCDVEYLQFRSLLREYFIQSTRLLYRLVIKHAGQPVAQAMQAELQRLLDANQWQITLETDPLQISPTYDLPSLVEILPPLLAAALQFAERVVGATIVQRELNALELTLDEKMLIVATDYGLRPNRRAG